MGRKVPKSIWRWQRDGGIELTSGCMVRKEGDLVSVILGRNGHNPLPLLPRSQCWGLSSPGILILLILLQASSCPRPLLEKTSHCISHGNSLYPWRFSSFLTTYSSKTPLAMAARCLSGLPSLSMASHLDNLHSPPQQRPLPLLPPSSLSSIKPNHLG